MNCVKLFFKFHVKVSFKFHVKRVSLNFSSSLVSILGLDIFPPGWSLAHELTVLPLALVNSATLVYQFSESRSFPVKPVTDVVVTIGVYESSEAIVDVVPELALVDNMVDFLTHSCNLSVGAELTDDILVVLALSECQSLVDSLLGVRYDVFQLQRSKLIPFVLGCFQSYTVRVFGVGHIEGLLRDW